MSATNDRASCAWISWTTEYVSGELRPDARRALEDHVRGCATCRRAREDAQAVREALLRRWEEPSPARGGGLDEGPSRYLARRVLERIPDDAWVPAAGGGLRHAVAAASILVVLILSGAWLLSVSGPGAAPPGRRAAGVVAGNAAEAPPGERVAALDDAALARAKAWLLSTQESDGSWDPSRWSGDGSYRVALTGLAVLGLHRTGKGTDEETRVISRAVRYLLSEQRPGGRFGEAGRGALYNHSIALLAVLEAETFGAAGGEGTRRPASEAVERGARYLVARQTPRGAWGYLERSGTGAVIEENASISVWALQALAGARSLGIRDLDGPLDRAGRYFTREIAGGVSGAPFLDGRHRCGREPAGGRLAAWSLIAAAGSDGRSGDARRALDRALRAVSDRGALSFYETYFLARLARGGGGALERRWSEARRELVRRQEHHGPLEGSWDPEDPWGPVGGRLYATTLAVLALGA